MKIGRCRPDPIVRPRLVRQRRPQFVLPVPVPFLLLTRRKIELRVGLVNNLLCNELQPIAGAHRSLPQRSAVGFTVIEVLRLFRIGPNFLKRNHGYFEKLFSAVVFVVRPVFCFTAFIGIHRRLVAVQAQLIVELLAFRCCCTINLS